MPPTTLPVHTGEVGVAIRFDLSRYGFFRDSTVEVQVAVSVVVSVESPGIALHTIRLQGSHFFIRHRFQLDVGYECPIAAYRTGIVTRAYPGGNLTDLKVLSCQVCRLPIEFMNPLLAVGWQAAPHSTQLQYTTCGIACQFNLD